VKHSLRALDIIIATCALTAYAPVFVVAAILIKLEDGGPVFFHQVRLGRGRHPFWVLKLRTMRDGSVTRQGRWLRKAALDEFPQFIHVLRGELSAVGPRPLTPEDVRRLGWQRNQHDERWQISPGVTGPTQVFGAGATAEASWLQDRDYFRVRTWKTDLRLSGLSVLINVIGKTRARELWVASQGSEAGAACG